MSKPVIILGAGGHSRVLIDILQLTARKIIGITDPFYRDREFCDLPILGEDEKILAYSPAEIELVNGMGSIGSTQKRKDLFQTFKRKGYHFANVIHPTAIISPHVTLEEGVQIMAGAILQPGTHIGTNSIINTKASVDHDCIIGAHVHIAPGVTLSGNCLIEDEVHVGTGATLIQGLRVGNKSVIGAGAVVIRDVPSGCTVVGNPAKVMET